MSWATVLTLVLKAVAGLSDYLANRQLLKAGEAEIIVQGLQKTLDNLQKAKHVAEEIVTNPDGNFSNRVREKYTRTDE